MAKADLEELYDLIPLGTEVVLSDDSLKELAGAKPAPTDQKGRYSVRPAHREENPGKVYNWL